MTTKPPGGPDGSCHLRSGILAELVLALMPVYALHVMCLCAWMPSCLACGPCVVVPDEEIQVYTSVAQQASQHAVDCRG